LGPVLINRTAVYKICKALPGELRRRNFQVSCSALLARVSADSAGPETSGERRLFEWSRRWLYWAISHPGVFNAVRPLTGLLPQYRYAGGIRLFLDPLYVLFYGVPQTGVVMVYDITPLTEPGWHHPHVSRLYDIAFQLIAQSGCHLVTSCQNTADQLRVNLGTAHSCLSVLPLGLFAFPEPAVCREQAPTAPFFLFVGATEERRKNVVGLIQAYERSGLYASRGIRLRIIGSHAGEDHPVVIAARSTPGVDLLGFVDDAELAASYANCLAFVYPSFCEGFGFPLLEAMHRGCVCLSTVTGASPEIGGKAALYVNPYDPADIINGLRRVADLTPARRRELAAQGKEQARAFTWQRFYDGLAEVLRQAG
jgi:glycosyltransferase involved in cell wall biosynthesis